MGLAQQKIEKLQKEVKAIKAKIDAMQAKKMKDPMGFSHIEKMQLQNTIGMYDELMAKIKALSGGQKVI